MPPPDSAQAAERSARLGELLATGRYPRFAAAVTQSGPPGSDVRPYSDCLLDRILDGLTGIGTGQDAGQSKPVR